MLEKNDMDWRGDREQNTPKDIAVGKCYREMTGIKEETLKRKHTDITVSKCYREMTWTEVDTKKKYKHNSEAVLERKEIGWRGDKQKKTQTEITGR